MERHTKNIHIDKTTKLSVIVSILLIICFFFYCYLIFLPQAEKLNNLSLEVEKEQAKIYQQKQKQMAKELKKQLKIKKQEQLKEQKEKVKAKRQSQLNIILYFENEKKRLQQKKKELSAQIKKVNGQLYYNNLLLRQTANKVYYKTKIPIAIYNSAIKNIVTPLEKEKAELKKQKAKNKEDWAYDRSTKLQQKNADLDKQIKDKQTEIDDMKEAMYNQYPEFKVPSTKTTPPIKTKIQPVKIKPKKYNVK